MDLKDLTLETLRQDRADLVAAIETSPAVAARVDAAAAVAAKAERDRILAIQGAAFAGQEALAAELIADGKTTAGEAALRFNQAEKASGGKRLADLRASDDLVKVPTAPSAGAAQPAPAPTALKTDDELKAEYAASAALQGEFRSEAAFLAFTKAERSGKIRVLKNRSAA